MEGLETEYRWVRIDAKVKTDMPDADIGFCTIETKHHGNMLFQKLNRDLHRMGFVVTPTLREKYRDDLTEAQAVEEVIEAMKPFKLKVERVE